MEVMTTKIIAMSLLAIVSIIIGFLPLKIGKYFFNDEKIWKQTFTSVLLCFGGGVLFATSFIHMLPEVCLILFIIITVFRVSQICRIAS